MNIDCIDFGMNGWDEVFQMVDLKYKQVLTDTEIEESFNRSIVQHHVAEFYVDDIRDSWTYFDHDVWVKDLDLLLLGKQITRKAFDCLSSQFIEYDEIKKIYGDDTDEFLLENSDLFNGLDGWEEIKTDYQVKTVQEFLSAYPDNKWELYLEIKTWLNPAVIEDLQRRGYNGSSFGEALMSGIIPKCLKFDSVKA